MPFVGDVERFVAQLYPNRVPIAVATLIVVAVLVVIGWRRGWHHAARRHPRATGTLLVAGLVVGLPVGWILGSPLFIRTQLNEPPPVAAISPSPPTPGPSPAGTAAPSRPAAATPTPSPTPAPLSLAGEFQGFDDFHFGEGTARLVETAPGRYTVRFEDFSVRNGPDLYVYLSPGPDGYTDGAIELGTLKATDGNFNYEVPAGVSVEGVRSVVVWCKAFSVQFAHATLEPA
jgi:hypothetical protein